MRQYDGRRYWPANHTASTRKVAACKQLVRIPKPATGLLTCRPRTRRPASTRKAAPGKARQHAGDSPETRMPQRQHQGTASPAASGTPTRSTSVRNDELEVIGIDRFIDDHVVERNQRRLLEIVEEHHAAS